MHDSLLVESYLKRLLIHYASLVFLSRGFYDRAEGNGKT